MTSSEIAGDENRRKIMGSHLFGEPAKPQPPEVQRPQQQQNSYFPRYQQKQRPQEIPVQNVSYVPQYNPQSYVPNMLPNVPKIDVIPQPAPLPSLQPFPDFHFEAAKAPESFDLGVQPRQISTNFTPTKLQMNTLDQMRKMREDIYRENTAFGDRLNNLFTAQQQQRPLFKPIPPPQQQQQQPMQLPTISIQQDKMKSEEAQQIPTSTEFLMPDGTPFKD